MEFSTQKRICCQSKVQKRMPSIGVDWPCGQAADERGQLWQGLFSGSPFDDVPSVGTASVPASIITKQNAITIGKSKDFIELFSMLG